MDPGGGWTTADASPLLRRPVTVPRRGTDSEDLVCRCITSKSGDVTKETKSLFTDDVGDVEQARTTQNLIVRHEIIPADVQDASLAPQMEGIQSFPISLCESPGLRAVFSMVNTHVEYILLG